MRWKKREQSLLGGEVVENINLLGLGTLKQHKSQEGPTIEGKKVNNPARKRIQSNKGNKVGVLRRYARGGKRVGGTV